MSGSLSVSARPCEDDIKRIAHALADVLHIDKKDLAGLDGTGVCTWLRKNLPSESNDRGITPKESQQKDLCRKMSVLLGDSPQQRETCGAVAGKMCELASSVIASFDSQYSKLEQAIATCSDAGIKAKLIACKTEMSAKKSQLAAQRGVVNSFAATAECKEAKTAAAWADKMTSALSSVPTLAEMIDVVCKSCNECEAACAEAESIPVSGGGCGCDSPPLLTGGWIHDGVSGGSAHGGLTIDTRIRKQTDERKRVMKDFRIRAEDLFNQILRAVYSLGQRMGKGSVPINDDLSRFVESFSQLENVYIPGIEYALTGFYTTSTATEQRERFLGKLQTLISTIGPLTGGANGDVFREIKTPLEELQKHCDKYSDMFRSSVPGLVQTRYGNYKETAGGEGLSLADRARSAAQGVGSLARDIPGAIHSARNVMHDSAAELGELKREAMSARQDLSRGGEEYDDFANGGTTLTKAGLTLKNVIKSLRHFYSVAKMRENLKKVSSESKQYNANYDEVLGKPFALLIDKERANFEKFKDALVGPISQSYVYGGEKIPIAAAYGTIKKAVENGSRDGDNISIEWNKEAITLMQLNSCNARIELYNVIQAIDLALLNFTDSITANPDDVKEISKLLDSTEIVAEWFNEASGDHVAGLFEYMPWAMEAKDDGSALEMKLSILGKNRTVGPATAIIDDKGSRLKKFTGGHYFAEVLKAETAGTHPGNPFLMISPARAEYARDFARKTVERMLSLKNIVAAFAFMGSRGRSAAVSGGDSSWEPARIYAALCKYLYTSAFAMGWDGYDAGVSGEDAKNQRFGKPYESKSPMYVDLSGVTKTSNIGNIVSSATRGHVMIGVLPFDGSASWNSILTPAGRTKLTKEGDRKKVKELTRKGLIESIRRDLDIGLGVADARTKEASAKIIEELHKIDDKRMLNAQDIDMFKRMQNMAALITYKSSSEWVKNQTMAGNDYSVGVNNIMADRQLLVTNYKTVKNNEEKKQFLLDANNTISKGKIPAAQAKFHTATAADIDLIQQELVDINKEVSDIQTDIDTSKQLVTDALLLVTNEEAKLNTAIDTGIRANIKQWTDKVDPYAALKNVVTPADIATFITGEQTTPDLFKMDFTAIHVRITTFVKDKWLKALKVIRDQGETDVKAILAEDLTEQKNQYTSQTFATARAIPGSYPLAVGVEADEAKQAAVITELGAEAPSPELIMLVSDGYANLGLGSWNDVATYYAPGGKSNVPDASAYAFARATISYVIKNAGTQKVDQYQKAMTNGNDVEAKSLLPDAYQPYFENMIAGRNLVRTYLKKLRGVAGGALSGYDTINWIDYCNAIDQVGATRGWIIAYNPGDNAKDLTIVPPFARCAFGCAMNSVAIEDKKQSGPFKTVGGWSKQFCETDELFMRAIKAMVAKVMTVSGLYNMLNFSSADDHTLSATRFIIGGGSDGAMSTFGGINTPASSLGPEMVPQVHDDAVELYIRLPLLVEFYRDVYSLTGKKIKADPQDTALIVALVPEMDQTWSSLMRLSFDSLSSGAVITKNYAARMINEINVIYDKYKSRGSSNLVSAVVNDFIADVNSRFGIMTRIESVKYKEMMSANRRAFSDMNNDDVLVDFDTLGDRDFSERKASALPSDKFVKSSAGATLGDTAEFNTGFINALSDFRNVIDKKIRDATYGATPGRFLIAKDEKANFHEQARITKNSLKLLTTPEQRFNTIYALMSGIDSIQRIDDNSHVMFHEVIIAPLAVIEEVYREMKQFVTNMKSEWDKIVGLQGDNPTFARKYTASEVEVGLNFVFVTVSRYMIMHVSSLSGMVDMNTIGAKVIIDHSKLQQFVEDLLGFVSRNIQKFRGTIHADIVGKYEISIRDLQSNLVEDIFRSENNDVDDNLEKASRLVTRMYGLFAKGKDEYNEGDVKVVLPAIAGGYSFCSAMRKLVYYDPYDIQANFAAVKQVLTKDSRLEKLFTKKIDGKDEYMYEDLMFASRWEIYEQKHQFSTNDPKNRSMGLMMRFNELLARYLEQFWDESNRKIYTPLISGIAANSDAAVNRSAGWPDLVAPLGHSSLPPLISERAPPEEWASGIANNFKEGIMTVAFDVVQIPKDLHDGIREAALTTFIGALSKSSSSIAPTQLVNILKHAFNETALKENLPAGGLSVRALEMYRNAIIEKLGQNWNRYGPIGAIAAAVFLLDAYIRAGAGNIDLDDILTKNKYKSPPVIPLPMSEFANVQSGNAPHFGNPDEIMFASIAKVIRTMLTTQDKGIPLYILPSLADSAATTPRMKENIRANLPIFAKMFGMIAESAKILGNILSTKINVDDRKSSGPLSLVGKFTHQDGVQGQVFAAAWLDSGNSVLFTGERAHNYLSQLLGKIAYSANSIITSSAEVMKEVSDNPIFLETSENSIAAYRNITNVTPFMPLSSMLAGVHDHLKPGISQTLLPLHAPGSRKFEFNYGTRFILGQPKIGALMDHAPGMREVVENYNKMVQNDKHVPLENVNRALSEYVQLGRWLTDINAYSPIICSMPTYKTPMSASDIVYQFDTDLDVVLDLTTNTDKQRSITALAQWVSKRMKQDDRGILDREKIQVMNILDLGVNPVNINALRREVPLVNMLNYSFTFDSFAKDIMGLSADISKISATADNRNMYLALAISPYRQKELDPTEWKTIFECYSDESAELGFGGHDRFAQDQIFRKALLYNRGYRRTDSRKQSGITDETVRYAYPTKDRPGRNRDNITFDPKNTLDIPVNQVSISANQDKYLTLLGQMRHDTTFIRNLLFISTAHRLMRVRLSDEMTRITFPVVSGPPAVSKHITDENVWETYDDVRRAYE